MIQWTTNSNICEAQQTSLKVKGMRSWYARYCAAEWLRMPSLGHPAGLPPMQDMDSSPPDEDGMLVIEMLGRPPTGEEV